MLAESVLLAPVGRRPPRRIPQTAGAKWVLTSKDKPPFLGTALGFAFAQTAAVVIAIFAAIGVGMALPYVVLALKPEWMELVPKPGPWMVWFKQLMGFLLMATVLWLL